MAEADAPTIPKCAATHFSQSMHEDYNPSRQ